MPFDQFGRRDVVRLLVGSAAAWPLAPRAQQPAMPVIGLLYPGSPESIAHLVAAFRKGLAETGYVEGQNVAIEYRWARNETDRLPELAADLVQRRVAVIVTPGSSIAPVAAKAATASIPIVFSMGGDPVQAGLVASFNQPGGNVTGFSSMNTQLGAKRLGLLHELVPNAQRFAALLVYSPAYQALLRDVQAGAASIGRPIDIVYASTSREVDAAFAAMVRSCEPAGPHARPCCYFVADLSGIICSGRYNRGCSALAARAGEDLTATGASNAE
jgi:putative ABC transport system substrate-binding protein